MNKKNIETEAVFENFRRLSFFMLLMGLIISPSRQFRLRHRTVLFLTDVSFTFYIKFKLFYYPYTHVTYKYEHRHKFNVTDR